MIFIDEMRDGDKVVGHYFCRERKDLKTKADKPYISLTLMDKTGEITARVWDVTPDIQEFSSGEFIKIDGEAYIYQTEMQMRLRRVRRSIQGEYDIRDYEKSAARELNEMAESLAAFVESVKDAHVKALLRNVFGDVSLVERLKRQPAAKTMHHAYIGGLLEHTLSVAEVVDFMCERFPRVNRDIVMAAALLHDIGKLWELTPFPANEYTDEGQLIGHIIMGADIVEREADKIDGFPPKTKLMLKHCVLAHHGEFEFGSPKLPQTMEAALLHLCDNLDAKMKNMDETLEAGEKTQGQWAGYSKMFGRNVMKT